ncbi:MAG: ABC transporter permease subunit [Eisenbergiella massiliensis]|uniref:Sugar ABC transporter permease n=2 Tax=Lachnospiraceae TaxID=186803 RepID=A0A6N7VYS4_9FIRM|nr:ABC transporter permease subunit [Eisenbergiella massiliensis]MCI6705429.1 ABC transporter permease subunit [Eisenbergiella massiliensis]MSS87412.1 sugar ABC transporter permease [Eisenbergiella porci]
MLIPALIYFIIFCYITMPGAYVAFVNYNPNKGIFHSDFVGFQNFEFLIRNGDLARITKNTLLYNAVFLLLGHSIQIVLAIMLSEIMNKAFKKVSQSVILLPHFISYVVVGVFAYNFFNFDNGFINSLLVNMGMERISFYSTPGVWKYIIVFFYIWKTTGYGMIVYMAAITGISSEIYEACYIDGATRFQRICYVTLPLLKPTFILLVLFGLGGILRGSFDLFYNLIGTNSTLYAQTDIIDTYVYRSLVGSFNFSSSAAVGLYQSVFGLVFVLIINLIVRKIEPESALF